MTDKDRAEIASHMTEAKGTLANLYICIHEFCTRQKVKPDCRGCKTAECMRIIAEQLERLEKMFIGGRK